MIGTILFCASRTKEMGESYFSKKYPNLSPTLIGDFDLSGLTDEQIAEEAIEFPGCTPEVRFAEITILVNESRQLLLDMAADWNIFGDVANRNFENEDDARKWLLR